MNKISKALRTGLTGIILGTTLLGCTESPEEKAARIEREKAQIALYEAQIEKKLDSIDGLARYSIPTIEIESKKKNFSLDPFKHIGNAMKAQKMSFPVSKEYFDSVNINDELSSKFNTAGLIFNGEIGGFSNSISDKRMDSMYCALSNNQCEQLEEERFEELLKRSEGRFLEDQAGIYVKEDSNIDLNEFTDSCDVNVETSKTNYTLDISKHIENAVNDMNLELSFPKFFCDQLKVGENIDRNFVGASLLFSKSPSQVNYKVMDLKKNY